VIDHLTRIVLDPTDEGRLAAPQHGQPECVEPGAVDHAAVVAKPALLIQDGYVEPPVVGLEAGRPEDRADLAAGQIQV
jgi:hypothetical protein